MSHEIGTPLFGVLLLEQTEEECEKVRKLCNAVVHLDWLALKVLPLLIPIFDYLPQVGKS